MPEDAPVITSYTRGNQTPNNDPVPEGIEGVCTNISGSGSLAIKTRVNDGLFLFVIQKKYNKIR